MIYPDTIFDQLKHLSHMGLCQNPFPVAPDNVNFFLSEHIDRVTMNIVHGIFSRKGGVSQGAFQSLNVSYGVGDEASRVQRNRHLISQAIGIEI